MHLGVQGFDATIEHFWKAGHIGHLGNGQALFRQQLGRAASRQQANALGVERARKGHNAGFVGYR